MRLALVQTDVHFGDPEKNAARLCTELVTLGDKGVDLAVFPEAFLTGYCFSSLEEARALALPLPGDAPVWSNLSGKVERTGVGVVVGFVGAEDGGVVNAAALLLPGEEPKVYRKSHLPYLGVDRFATPGRELPVFETKWGIIGILICYDLRIPEPNRVLALKGAQLIVLPTNWPGSNQAADHFTVVRAAENKVFFAACDRVGEERGFRFIGRSGIYAPDGSCLAKAGDGEETLIVDIDLGEALDKRNVYRPGEYELDLWGCRQPELYTPIGDPNC